MSDLKLCWQAMEKCIFESYRFRFVSVGDAKIKPSHSLCLPQVYIVGASKFV